MEKHYVNYQTSLRNTTLIAKAGVKMDERIHITGCAGLFHFMQHGDLTVLTQLSKAMPKSGRGNALKFWITKHVPVKWNAKAYKGAGGFIVDKKRDAITGEDQDAVMLEATMSPFYLKEDKEASVWNPNTAIISLVKKLEHAKEGNTLSIDASAIEALTTSLGIKVA